jgi:RiboL-PSP-HEPN
MAGTAKRAFEENAADIVRLIELHEQIGGNAPGRREGLEVLNKSAIVLITSYWEAYCEDVANEALAHIIKHARTAEALPQELRKQLAQEIKKASHDLEIWKIADDGWKKYLSDRIARISEDRNRRLNTPKTEQINQLFFQSVGLRSVSDSWKWSKKMTISRAQKKLDEFIELRGAIAHRGKAAKSVKKADVTNYFEFVKKLVAETGKKVNKHVLDLTGHPL